MRFENFGRVSQGTPNTNLLEEEKNYRGQDKQRRNFSIAYP